MRARAASTPPPATVAAPLLPPGVWLVLLLYFVASFSHFTHNTEFIAAYPNMPGWLELEHVYGVWAVFTAVGVLGLALRRLGRPSAGALTLALYGALGLYGVGHYALGLCAEHPLLGNLSIAFEVAAGLALLMAGLNLYAPVRHAKAD